jgi:hypothetical protein
MPGLKRAGFTNARLEGNSLKESLASIYKSS